MLTKKKDAVEQLNIYRALLEKIVGKECTISFDMHTSDGFIVSGIELISLQKLKIKPDKREFDGKMKSPVMFEIQNNQASLVFAFDDTVIVALMDGIRIIVDLDKPLNGKDKIEVDIRLS